MKIEGTDIKIHAEALGCALRDSGKTKAGSTVLALVEYVKELESRLEKAEKDAARWKNCALSVSSSIDFALSVCEDRGADSLAIEELRDAKSSIYTAMQSAK